MIKYDSIRKYLSSNQFTWLVTGCAGFIGSNIAEELLLLNQKVVGVDNFSTGHKKNIESLLLDSMNRGKFSFIEGDVTDLDFCHQIMDGVNFVSHQAALGSVPRSIEFPEATNINNVTGHLNMLIAANRAKVESFVYASSSSVYGDHSKLPKIEQEVGNPLSPYAVSKKVNELYSDVFYRLHGMKVIGLRYFNVFGKRQDPDGPYAAVIPKWISSLIKGESVVINGDGETSRDFCYIKNVTQMNILSSMADASAFGEVYNVACGERMTLNDLFMALKSGLNLDVEAEYHDFRRGDVRHSLADISKARERVGYEPLFSANEGLSQSLSWYVENLA